MTVLKTSEILEQAVRLIANPDHHCTGHYAEKKDGMVCDINDPEAYRFCAYGAADHIAGQQDHNPPIYFLEAACKQLHGFKNIPKVNDRLGHDATLEMYQLAIKLAKYDEVPKEG